MSKHVVFINGSPHTQSRSTGIASAIAERLDAADIRVRRFGLSDFESSELLYARADGRVAQHYLGVLETATAVVFSTPVYKATFSGGLKLLIDLIPHDMLRGKIVLAVASARIGRHFNSVQRAFDDLYRFFDVGFVVPPVFVLDEQVQIGPHGTTRDANTELAIERAATALVSAVFAPESESLAG